MLLDLGTGDLSSWTVPLERLLENRPAFGPDVENKPHPPQVAVTALSTDAKTGVRLPPNSWGEGLVVVARALRKFQNFGGRLVFYTLG